MEDDLIAELEGRLARHPADRYPIQHATALFHLGTAHLHDGALDQAIDSFTRSAELFEPLPLQRAKSSNMAGIALREAGRAAEAASAFELAATGFASGDAVVEEAAARYNLGLVHAQGEERASPHFAASLELFRATDARRQAAAAARELGHALLVEGDVAAALEVLDIAVSTSQECGDETGRGASANALGLARLADDDAAGAVEAFRIARAAHPRTLRGPQHAMAVANLALALERCGDRARARLFASQARAVPGADEPVRSQSEAILARLGDGDDALVGVLGDEGVDERPALVRDELERWADDTVEARWRATDAVAREFGRSGASDDVTEAVLGGVLELPPDRFSLVTDSLRDAVARLDADAGDRARSRLRRVAARFHLPQMARLEEALGLSASPGAA